MGKQALRATNLPKLRCPAKIIIFSKMKPFSHASFVSYLSNVLLGSLLLRLAR